MNLQGAQRFSHSDPFRCVFFRALLVVEVYLRLTCINNAAWLDTSSYLYCKVVGVFCATAKTTCTSHVA